MLPVPAGTHDAFWYSPDNIPALLPEAVCRTSCRQAAVQGEASFCRSCRQAPPCPLPRHGTLDIFLDIKVLLKFLLFASFHLSDPVIQSTVPGLLAGIVDHLCKRLRTSHQCHTRACSCNCCIQKISVHKHPRPCKQRDHHCRVLTSLGLVDRHLQLSDAGRTGACLCGDDPQVPGK